mgnify:CR=1 FL=1|tara:strand:+ start:8976 stop:9371 length:396 start_codon:yes stop_codon:yes gene_type:complete
MKKTFTMPAVEPRKFYRQYIELLQPILNLRKREADVFAELLYHNYLRREIQNADDRFRLVFDISTRNQIGTALGTKDRNGNITPLSNAVIQQALGGLRKKNVIQGIKLREAFTIAPEGGVFNLTFKFVVNE